MQKVGQVAYKLKLPNLAKIHPVFHVSQLKLCRGNHDQPYVPLPICDFDVSLVIQPVVVLKSCVILKENQQVPRSLIQ